MNRPVKPNEDTSCITQQFAAIIAGVDLQSFLRPTGGVSRPGSQEDDGDISDGGPEASGIRFGGDGDKCDADEWWPVKGSVKASGMPWSDDEDISWDGFTATAARTNRKLLLVAA